MKKLILVLAMALIASSAFGALSISLTRQGTSNLVDVNYAGADPCNLPRAFALIIEVNSTTADVCGISNYKVGESNSVSRGFGIYPAKIQITDGNVTGWGDPLAEQGDPGAEDQVLPSRKVVLEFGSLYAPVHDSVNCPATSGRLCTLAIDCNGASSNITITANEENPIRGGVVLENGTTPDPNLTASLVYTGCQLKCLKNPPSVEYNDWVKYGEPNCWCFKRQCRGDADGKASMGIWVATPDLNLIKAAFNKADTILKNITNGICTDFDHKASMGIRVATTDLNTMKAYFNKAETRVHCCDDFVPDGNNCILQPGDKYNFWTN